MKVAIIDFVSSSLLIFFATLVTHPLFIYLFVCLFVCLSIYLFIYFYTYLTNNNNNN